MFGEKDRTVVYIGSDHAGFEAKGELKKYLEDGGYNVTDLGCFTPEPCDYPDVAREVGEKVAEHGSAFGILICGTGIGVAMAANKVRGVRAAQATDENLAEMARKHNNANIVTMGAR
ncbi:MAG: RpiB/LacA/LacB family sugar-phosphate isomerase, partial [Candidatus Peregrinibacteria bacterium]